MEQLRWCSEANHWIGFMEPLRRGSSACQGQPLPVAAQDHLVKATKLSAYGSCLYWAWRHMGRATLQTEVGFHLFGPREAQQKIQGTLRSTTTFWLSMSLSCWKTLRLFMSWIRQGLRELPV